MRRKLITIVLSCCVLVAFIPTFTFAEASAEEESFQQVTDEQLDLTTVEEQRDFIEEQPVIDESEVIQEDIEEPSAKMPIDIEKKAYTDDVVKISHIWPLSNKYVVDRNGGEWNEWVFHYQHGHYGIDSQAPTGTKVYATADGTVAESENSTGYGQHVLISHSDGTYSLYGHLSKRAVTTGKSVKQGQIIGYVGSTGSSTGPHLHYGIYKSKYYFTNEWDNDPSVGTVNPELYLQRWLTLSSEAVVSTGKPKVLWTKYPGTAKYRIYAKKTSAKKYTYLTYTTKLYYIYPKAIPTYGYHFKIKAVNSSGKVLKTSAVKYQICKIARPSITKASRTEAGNLKIEFKGKKNANIYELYRAESKDGKYEKIFRSNKRSTVDKGGESRYIIVKSGTVGKTYFFKVRACNAKYSSADSELSEAFSAVR